MSDFSPTTPTVDISSIVKNNPFLGSLIQNPNSLVDEKQIESIREAIARAFLVPDDHFDQIAKQAGLTPQQVISLGDWGMIGNAVISPTDRGGKLLSVQIRLTTAGCPSKVKMKSQVEASLKKAVSFIRGLEDMSVVVIDHYEGLAKQLYRPVEKPAGLFSKIFGGPKSPDKLTEILEKLNSGDPKKSNQAYLELREEAAVRRYKMIVSKNPDLARTEDQQGKITTRALEEFRVIFEWTPAWIPESTIEKMKPYIQARESGRLGPSAFLDNYAIPAIKTASAYYQLCKEGGFPGLRGEDREAFKEAQREAFGWVDARMKEISQIADSSDILSRESFDSSHREGVFS